MDRHKVADVIVGFLAFSTQQIFGPHGSFKSAHLARISHHFFESSRFGGTWGRERESFGRSGGESALS